MLWRRQASIPSFLSNSCPKSGQSIVTADSHLAHFPWAALSCACSPRDINSDGGTTRAGRARDIAAQAQRGARDPARRTRSRVTVRTCDRENPVADCVITNLAWYQRMAAQLFLVDCVVCARRLCQRSGGRNSGASRLSSFAAAALPAGWISRSKKVVTGIDATERPESNQVSGTAGS